MKYKFIFSTIFLNIFLILSVNAQCNVSVSDETDFVSFHHIYEELEEPEGARSWISYMASLWKVSNGIDFNEWYLRILGAEYHNSRFAIPRQIRITFMNGEALHIQADKMTRDFKKGIENYYSIFVIDNDKINLLEKSIKRISFIDHRKDNGFTLRPDYSKILVEQLECIENQYSLRFR